MTTNSTQQQLEYLSDKKISSISKLVIKKILKNPVFLKSELVRLGNKRFGIPNSKLQQLSKERVIIAILSALNHEESLEIIPRQVKRIYQFKGKQQ